MDLSRLIVSEIRYRRGNFLIGALVVAMAVLCLAGAVALLRAFDVRTDAMIAAMEARTKQEMDALEDSIRKSMKGLGFNIYIFPEGQDLGEVYSQGYATETMPEKYVERLAESKIVTVNHLLPSLTRKLKWPEKERTVLLIGVRGEVPLMHRAVQKKPLIDPIEEGAVVLGFELHTSMDLEPGDEIRFMNRSFRVAECYSERGNVDDITIWMNLAECQELLDLEGRINAIQALECNCATIDRLGEVRAELGKILPGTKIIETQSKALARAEARNQAARTARQQMDSTRSERAAQKQERARLAAVLLPVLTVGGMGIIALLTVLNVRERTAEIGVLHALGVRTGRLLLVFMARAFAVGLTGAVGALAVVAGVGDRFGGDLLAGQSLGGLLGRAQIWMLLVVPPLLACLAAWIPSLLAAQRDPAEVLRHD